MNVFFKLQTACLSGPFLPVNSYQIFRPIISALFGCSLKAPVWVCAVVIYSWSYQVCLLDWHSKWNVPVVIEQIPKLFQVSISLKWVEIYWICVSIPDACDVYVVKWNILFLATSAISRRYLANIIGNSSESGQILKYFWQCLLDGCSFDPKLMKAWRCCELQMAIDITFKYSDCTEFLSSWFLPFWKRKNDEFFQQ